MEALKAIANSRMLALFAKYKKIQENKGILNFRMTLSPFFSGVDLKKQNSF